MRSCLFNNCVQASQNTPLDLNRIRLREQTNKLVDDMRKVWQECIDPEISGLQPID